MFADQRLAAIVDYRNKTSVESRIVLKKTNLVNRGRRKKKESKTTTGR